MRVVNLPQYVSVEEVRRVCQELGISDWTVKATSEVSSEEAEVILGVVDTEDMNIPLDDFRRGLEVELEHGMRYASANVTNNHPILTGMIVLAHLKEMLDYYERLDVTEIEGEILQAILSRDLAGIERKYKQLVEARKRLDEAVSDQLRQM